MRALIKCKLLTKNPSAHSFEPTDVLSVNADYKSSLFRNKIPVMVSKEKKDKEGNVTDEAKVLVAPGVVEADDRGPGDDRHRGG